MSAPNPYPTAPAPRVARWRDVRGIAIVALIVGLFDAFVLLPHAKVILRCDRASGACVLDVQQLVHPFTRTIPLRDFYGVRTHWERREKTSSTKDLIVTLDVKGPSIDLPRSGLDQDRLALAEDVRAFLKSRDQDRLELAYGGPTPRSELLLWLLPTPFLLLIAVFLSPAVWIWADRARGKLVFERRPFGPFMATRREFDLNDVREATTTRRDVGFRVYLAMADGTTVTPGAWAAGDGVTASALQKRINEIVSSAR